MASQEKLQKSLEALKNLSNFNQPTDYSRKKEKIHHCHVVTEAFSNPTIRVSTNFPVLLGVTIETFLKLCDDPESDIRMISGECLNRIIRAVGDAHISKVQIALHKEINKNGSSRSLQAALTRFAQLAHHIRPHKGNPYVANLFPFFIKIAERTEVSIHETMAATLPDIIKVLGCFASENEIRTLLKAFLQNVNKPSAAIRRMSASCISSICKHSRRPYVFSSICINKLLDMVIPINNNQDSSTILGVLNCLKLLLPLISKSVVDKDSFGYLKETDISQPFPINKLMQIYELCLYYLSNQDHNIINAALETLNVFIRNTTGDTKEALLNPTGIDKYRIHKSQSINNIRSPSVLSIATNLTSNEEHLFSECELTETIETDIERWIGESKLSAINIVESTEKSQSSETFTYNRQISLDTGDFGGGSKIPEEYGMHLKSVSVDDNLDKLSEKSSDVSILASGSEERILDSTNEYQEIDPGHFLDKSVPLLYCTRLITKQFLLYGTSGKYINDKTVRVSVKSSALSCLSGIFTIYPQVFFTYLDKNHSGNARVSKQKISDIMIFADHSDPQLRGMVRSLAAELLVSILQSSNLDFKSWVDDVLSNTGIGKDQKFSLIEEFVDVLLKGLKDENSSCLKTTLTSLNPVVSLVSVSSSCRAIVPILEILPFLANNPYWLVKVALCELVSKFSYVDLYHITGDNRFQSKIIYNILFEFLKDPDQRIRTAASKSIVELIPNLYFPEYRPTETPVTTRAKILTANHSINLCDKNYETGSRKAQFIKTLPFPYSEIAKNGSDKIDYSLSKIVMRLYGYAMTSNSKPFIHGCIEALSLLSQSYPCTLYKRSWNNADTPNTDLFSLSLSFFNSTTHVYDVNFLISIVNLTSNLYAGHSTSLLKPVDLLDPTSKQWTMFPKGSFRSSSEQYLLHTLKLLNIFHHVINDVIPPPPQAKTVLTHLPTPGTLSPIKKRKSDEKKIPSPGRIVLEREEKPEKKDSVKISGVGYFGGSAHYMKIFEVLRGGYVNYKASLDPSASKNFVELLRKTLHTLSVIMEVATLHEFGRISEEILTYMKSTFILEPVLSVQCVQQLLKCLFGTNLTANFVDIFGENTNYTEDETYSFYHNVFQKSYEELASCINSLSKINKIECDGDSTIMGYLHRKDVKKPTAISRSSDKTLASYIMIFEPMVIKSLRQYTITSNTRLQCNVLQLLSQLIQLRVNYCLLDSEQIFKDFVLKQFDYIEEGKVPFPEELVPKIFQFLVHLSHNQQHSKSIISIPKIIQLCDGLMASEQDPRTHCIPALGPIVEDVFLVRNRSNTSDVRELETTREVVLSMLLRLLEYKEVINLVVLVLNDSKYCIDDAEKWLRWSGQVASVFLLMLKQNKIRIGDVETFSLLVRLVFALYPNVFKPEDEIIVMLFQTPPATSDDVAVNRWMSKILILLLLLSPLKEDLLLSKINNCKAEFSPGSIFENVTITADPLNVYSNADTFRNLTAEVIFSKLIFRIVEIISGKVLGEAYESSNNFLVSQFSLFLMYCSHAFQSGTLCKVSQAATPMLINKNSTDIDLEQLNSRFVLIGKVFPTITFQWFHVLSILSYNDLHFWNKVLINEAESFSSINDCIVKTGGTIVLCDYLCENISETKQLNWMLSENALSLVNFCDEMPVSDFISFVHRNATLSKLFIGVISKTCLDNPNAFTKTKILKCLENAHLTQTGAVIKILVPKLLNNRQIAVSRVVSNLAGQKLEYLFTLPMEDVQSQLSRDDLFIIKEELNVLNLAKKHETLVSLLNKLLVQFYDMSPLELRQNRFVNPEHIRKLQITKKWFLSQIQGKYQDGGLRKETAKVMRKLEYNELVSFNSSEDFNKLIFRDCVESGVKLLRNNDLKEEPPILKAAIDSILKEISKIVNGTCANHEVFTIELDQNSYSKQMEHNFNDASFSSLVLNLCLSLTVLIKSLTSLPTLQLSEVDLENISKFSVVSLEFLNYIVTVDRECLNINNIDVLLTCSTEILKQSQFSNYLGLGSNISWLCSGINSTHELVSFLLINEEPLPSVDRSIIKTSLENPETRFAGEACHKLYVLVCWLFHNKNKNINIPSFLASNIKCLVVSLSRLPLVNAYVLIPLRVWKLGWRAELSGQFCTLPPPIPIDMLQKIDVLEEYIFRITLLGWTTRQQFEETWMCLLSVLCIPLDNMDSADIARHASSLAIKAITALLLQTLRYPVLGNKNVSKVLHVSRNMAISDSAISIKKLKIVQDHIESKCKELSDRFSSLEMKNVFDYVNFEKLTDDYSYGQLSIRYLAVASNSGSHEPKTHTEILYAKRVKLLNESGLDVNSCLQFLLEYYSQLIKAEPAARDLRILHETVRSILFISDLFIDKTQFNWMLNTFLDLTRIHAVEDELLHQYLIIGICKSVGVLTPDLDVYEQTKKLLVQFLKSPYVPSRIACMYGMLYIIEGCLLNNITIGGVSEELQLILPCAVEYIQLHLNSVNPVLNKCQEHTMLMWSLAFYLMENVEDIHMEINFVANTIQTAFGVLQLESYNSCVQKRIIKGLERLLLIKPLYILENVGKNVQKLALEKMKDDNPTTSILGVQLLVTYMYVDCWEHLEKHNYSDIEQSSPDHLVQTIEKISAIFERIKKSFVVEVKILCSVLPMILRDFFSPSDILTKVIGEFLSPQQPHPKLMSGVVFQVFESAIEQNQLSLLQDWVVFSLSNFTQSFSNMATWCLTCFFISASSNKWLRSFFPYVQARVGRYEYEDKKIFCIAGSDFYRNLIGDKQRKTFVDNFVKVKDHPDMPFNDLLNSL